MATAEDYAQWIVNNADKRGTPEFDTVAKAYQQVRGAKQEAPMNLDPTEGMSGTQKFLAGVGKAMVDTGRGIGQLIPVRRNGEWQPLVTSEDVAESRKRDAPLMNTGAGMAGNFVGNVATLLPTAAIPGVNTAVGATVLGAGTGFIQPSESLEERAANTGFGAAGGYVGQKIGDAATRLLGGSRNFQQSKVNVGPSQSGATASVSGNATLKGSGGGYNFGAVGDDASAGLTQAQKATLERGKQMGFKVTPGQQTGSRALQQLEAKLESQPMTSGAFNAIKDNNQKVLNRAAARAIGEDADVLDAGVLEKALDRIGGVYNMVKVDKPAPINPDDFLGRLSSIEGEFEGLANVTAHPLVNKFVGYAEKGAATQRQLADLSSKLGRVANNQMTGAAGDRELGLALFQVKDMADDMLEGNLTGETLKQFQKARGEYRNLMLLTSRQGVINPSSGNVAGGSLASALQSKDKRGFMFNKNQSELYDAARFAQAFRPIVGDSGTATRSVLPTPTDFVLSLPFNLATRAYTSAPAVSVTNTMQNGMAPNMSPLMLRRMQDASRTGLLGIANTVQE